MKARREEEEEERRKKGEEESLGEEMVGGGPLKKFDRGTFNCSTLWTVKLSNCAWLSCFAFTFAFVFPLAFSRDLHIFL